MEFSDKIINNRRWKIAGNEISGRRVAGIGVMYFENSMLRVVCGWEKVVSGMPRRALGMRLFRNRRIFGPLLNDIRSECANKLVYSLLCGSAALLFL